MRFLCGNDKIGRDSQVHPRLSGTRMNDLLIKTLEKRLIFYTAPESIWLHLSTGFSHYKSQIKPKRNCPNCFQARLSPKLFTQPCRRRVIFHRLFPTDATWQTYLNSFDKLHSLVSTVQQRLVFRHKCILYGFEGCDNNLCYSYRTVKAGPSHQR